MGNIILASRGDVILVFLVVVVCIIVAFAVAVVRSCCWWWWLAGWQHAIRREKSILCHSELQ